MLLVGIAFVEFVIEDVLLLDIGAALVTEEVLLDIDAALVTEEVGEALEFDCGLLSVIIEV